ncbi:MAG: hypothetical protein WC836_00205 [Desulfobacula sp.]|jgi:hypothetical protein
MKKRNFKHVKKMEFKSLDKLAKFLPVAAIAILIFSSFYGWFYWPSKNAEAANFDEVTIAPYFNYVNTMGADVFALLKVTISDADAGSLERIIVQGGGTSPETEVPFVAVFLDDNGGGCGGSGDGIFDSSDTVMGATGGFGNNAFDSSLKATFDKDFASYGFGTGGLSSQCPLTTTETYFVTYAYLGAFPAEGHSVSAQIFAMNIEASLGVDFGPAVDSAVSTLTFNTLNAPVLQSFTSSTINGTYGPTSEINITANYDKPLESGSSLDVTLSNGETLTLNNVAGSSVSGVYTVGAWSSGQDSADLSVNPTLGIESVSDLFGNIQTASIIPAGQNLGDNQALVIDTTTNHLTPPTLLSFTSTTANGTYTSGDSVNITANYNEALDIRSALSVTLDNGVNVALNNVSGSSVSGTYLVGAPGSGEGSLDLTVSAIVAGENVRDRYGNSQAASLVPGAPNNIADSSAIVIVTDIGGQSSNLQLLDSDSNGIIDRVTFDIANPLGSNWGLSNLSPFGLAVTQGGASRTITGVTITTAINADPVGIQIDLNEATMSVNTDGVNTAVIELTYTAGGADKIISDNLEELNAISTGDTNYTNTEIDKAAPSVLDLIYKDYNGDGTVDHIDLTMSPDSELVCAYDGGDWTIDTSGTVGLATFSNCTTNGNLVELTVSGATPAITGGVVDPAMTYTNIADRLSDGAGNATAGFGSSAVTDGAAPVPVSAIYKDITLVDGQADRIDITMSADIGLAGTYDASDWTFPDAGSINVIGSSGMVISGDDILLGVTGTLADTTGGPWAPTISYINNGDRIVDGAGNISPTSGSVTVTDGVSPIILSAEYTDSANNGDVDQVVFTTTADAGINCGSFTAMTDFTVDNVNTLNLDENIGDACGSNGVNSIIIQLGTTGSAATTGGAVNPVVSYNQPGNGVADGTNNYVPNALSITVTDGAPPIPISAEYKDINNNGTVDRVDITMTTDISLACSFEAGDWSFPTSGQVNPAPTGCSVNGNDIRLAVNGATAVTGGSIDPTVRYWDLGTAGSVKDGANNAVSDFGAAGITVTDAAAPAPISAAYYDRDPSDYRLSVDATIHNDYGLTYPATYEFLIPVGSSGLKAYKRLPSASGWTQITEKYVTDYFNGIEAVRFDYVNNRAYISVAIPAIGNIIYLRITDASDQNVTSYYLGITKFYDNREAAVVVTADDWTSQPGRDAFFTTAIDIFRTASMWITPDINTYYAGNPASWSVIQAEIDAGYVEPASHSRTHTLGVSPYDDEIGGSKSDILNNLDMPALDKRGSTEYLYAWVEPGGFSDATARHTLGIYKYLADRGINPSALNDYAVWDSANGLYGTSNVSIEGDFILDLASTNNANSRFDNTVAANGIYHLWLHPETTNMAVGSPFNNHVDYIKGKKNLWYAGFGHLYLYHYMDDQNLVTVQKVNNFIALDQKVDTVDITMSADSGLTCAFSAGDWSVPIPGTVNITGITNCLVYNNVITLPVTGTLDNTTSGAIAPAISYINNSDRLADANGNVTFDFSFLTVTDGIRAISSGGGYVLPLETPVPPVIPPVVTNPPLVLHGSAPAGPLPAGVMVGDLIKSKDFTTVYFIDSDNRRHTFPNEPTYFSYFSSFKGIKILPLSTLSQIEIGANVTVKPGTWLVKIQTDPKVYALEPYGVLRYVSTVDIASKLYGSNWTARIIDISPAFFVDYQVGDPLSILVHPAETVIKYQNSANIYFIDQGKKRLIPPDVFINNKFQTKSILDDFDQSISYSDGNPLVNQKIEDIIAIR